jgi:hypothetical protein
MVHASAIGMVGCVLYVFMSIMKMHFIWVSKYAWGSDDKMEVLRMQVRWHDAMVIAWYIHIPSVLPWM